MTCPHAPKGTDGSHHWRPEYRMVGGKHVGSMVCAYCGAKYEPPTHNSSDSEQKEEPA